VGWSNQDKSNQEHEGMSQKKIMEEKMKTAPTTFSGEGGNC